MAKPSENKKQSPNIINKPKRHRTNWEKIFAKLVHRDIISLTYKTVI